MPMPFFFIDTAPTEIYPLSLHDALPISTSAPACPGPTYLPAPRGFHQPTAVFRSEEHTSELQSRRELVCRLLLEKKKPFAAAANRAVDPPRACSSTCVTVCSSRYLTESA